MYFGQHHHRILVDWCIEGIHELFSPGAYLCENAFYVLLDSIEASIDASDDLIATYRLVDVEVLFTRHGDF